MRWGLSTPILRSGTFAFIYLNRSIYHPKDYFTYVYPKKLPTKKLITSFMVIFSRFDHVWIHKPISLFSLRTTFSYFSHQLQNWTSKTSLCFGDKVRPKITYQPYSGIYTICTLVTAVFYHLALKFQSPVRGVHLHSQEVEMVFFY